MTNRVATPFKQMAVQQVKRTKRLQIWPSCAPTGWSYHGRVTAADQIRELMRQFYLLSPHQYDETTGQFVKTSEIPPFPRTDDLLFIGTDEGEFTLYRRDMDMLADVQRVRQSSPSAWSPGMEMYSCLDQLRGWLTSRRFFVTAGRVSHCA